MKTLLRLVFILFGLSFLGAVGAGVAGLYVFYTFGSGLPDYTQLKDYEPPVMTRVHAGDGRLLAEYAIERRVFVPIEAIPKRVRGAFMSAEDKSFYKHKGIDFRGVARAVITNAKNYGQGRRLVGASTITQQVAKNFLLTNVVSYERKIKEAILALRIEQALEKDRILELYLNEIYLGYGSYGVAAAALNYFNKSLRELSISEMAYLAALPKAPNNYHPVRKYQAAIERRNWVIRRMTEDGVISAEEAAEAREEPLRIFERDDTEYVSAPYFAEEVRRDLEREFGEEKLYKGGLSVRTTIDPKLQAMAHEALRSGLEAYDRRHGWRGPINQIETGPGWAQRLADVDLPRGTSGWYMGVVLKLDETHAEIGFTNGGSGTLPLAEMAWARKWLEDQKRGPRIRVPSDALNEGDVVWVEPVAADEKGEPYPEATFALRQIPDINGGIVAMDPHTGRVLAMVGGYSRARSEFNRVTQARRQPGSAFKPFVYLAGLEHGFTPSSLILDAPFVLDQGPGLPKWRPANYTDKFYGPSTMRLGVEKSRNLMTVRLAQTVGMETISDYAAKFGITENLPEQLSMALGSGETTLMSLASAYAMLVNGGKEVKPSLIDRIQDRNGRAIFRHDTRACSDCMAPAWSETIEVPDVPDNRAQVTDPASAFQVVSMLEGAVERGTGRRISRAIDKPLAGKTGTTNSSFDTWFMGFSPDLVVGVFVGFDTPKTMGPRETGSSVAAPIFRDFMLEALADVPGTPFRTPPGISMVRVNSATGQLATPADRNVIWEAFKKGNEPTGDGPVIGSVGTQVEVPTAGASGGGGLY